MLVRLLYASRPVDGFDAEALHAILRTAKEHNARAGITGVLCHCANAKVFLQALEGGRVAVNALYAKIVADPRHRDVVLLTYEEIAERRFAGWSMGQVHMSRLNPAVLLKYSPGATLDPYAVSGRASLALLDELVATASIGNPG